MLKPLLVSLLLCLFVPAGALAQTPKPQVDPAARQAFEAGADAYDHGRFADALREFDRAYQLSPTPKLQFNIGRAADGDGQIERAIGAYNAYLQAFPKADNREFVESRIVKLRETQAATAAPLAPVVAPVPAVSLAPADVAAADIASQSAPASPVPVDDGGKKPVWKKAWFWGTVGAVVVAAVVVGVVVATSGGGGTTKYHGAFNESDQTLVRR